MRKMLQENNGKSDLNLFELNYILSAKELMKYYVLQ